MTTLSTKDWGLIRQQLIDHEGLPIVHGLCPAYHDSRGFLTIGVGRLIDGRLGGGITRAEAMFLLDNDIRREISELVVRFPWFEKLAPPYQRVLVDLDHNLGITKLSEFVDFLKLMESGSYAAAGNDLMKTALGHQEPKRMADLDTLLKGPTT